MTHLPECERWFTDMPEPDECPACEMFRACEQRVLNAAREAVAALDYPHIGSSVVVEVKVALAVIEALREKP